VKQTVERIVPFVPAFATVGASVCASLLLLATGPQTLAPPPVVPPLTREVARIVASLSPPTHVVPGGRDPVVASPHRRRLSSPVRRSATSTPASQHSSKQLSPVGAPAAPPPPKPNPPPAPTPPAPAVTPPAPPVTRATASEAVKPGWGHGDRNHAHSGPPGRRSSGRKNEATSAPAGPPAAAGAEQNSIQNGEEKSTGSQGRGSGNGKNQAKPDPPGQPAAAGTAEHGPTQNGEKKSTGR
jgi:hypothetical protein